MNILRWGLDGSQLGLQLSLKGIVLTVTGGCICSGVQKSKESSLAELLHDHSPTSK